jgi:hypothetical protein
LTLIERIISSDRTRKQRISDLRVVDAIEEAKSAVANAMTFVRCQEQLCACILLRNHERGGRRVNDV